MLISLTFDDSVQDSFIQLVYSLFSTLKNPNNCPAKATFFGQVLYSNPYQVQKWTSNGNEFAGHSITHSTPTTYSYQELEGNRGWASTYGGVNRGKIIGNRHTFLSYSVESINRLASMGFTYDSSMRANPDERLWPYTFDYGSANDCTGQFSVCNQKLNASGLWNIPSILN